jgi:hypothetical protein
LKWAIEALMRLVVDTASLICYCVLIAELKKATLSFYYQEENETKLRGNVCMVLLQKIY